MSPTTEPLGGESHVHPKSRGRLAHRDLDGSSRKKQTTLKGHLEWSWLQTGSHIPLAWYQLALHTEDSFEFGPQSQKDPLMMLTRKVQKILRTKQNHSAWLVFQLHFSE